MAAVRSTTSSRPVCIVSLSPKLGLLASAVLLDPGGDLAEGRHPDQAARGLEVVEQGLVGRQGRGEVVPAHAVVEEDGPAAGGLRLLGPVAAGRGAGGA